MRSLVACKLTSLTQVYCLPREVEKLLTPNGHRVIFVAAPVHAGFVGGAAANVFPATSHSIGHAVAVMVNGGRPESKTGEGSLPSDGVLPWKVSVSGSMAYCQGPVASNSRSTARGSCAFAVSTLSLREMSYA